MQIPAGLSPFMSSWRVCSRSSRCRRRGREQVHDERAVNAVLLANLAADDDGAAKVAAEHREAVADAAVVALDGRLLLRELAHRAQPGEQAHLDVAQAVKDSGIPVRHCESVSCCPRL